MTNEQHIEIQAVEEAQAAYEKALESQRQITKELDEFSTSLSTWREKFDEAKKVLDEAKPFVNILKARLQKAKADVTITRAELVKLAPEKVASNGNAEHGKVREAVIALLRGAGQMSTDAIFAKLQEQGVEMSGANPRSNLNAYISRWSKIPETGIVNVERGVWGIRSEDKAADVPAFLSPEPTGKTVTLTPDFLTPVDPQTPQLVKVDVHYSEKQTISEYQVPPETAPMLGALPTDFPGRDALTEAGYHTLESLAGKTHDQLRRIKGVGAGTAREILAALEA